MNEWIERISSSPAAPHWQKIGIKSHHGINIPLFSLHSKQSCGIGEFPDLLPIISWCKQIGFDVIQLLPLNDTGNETSPYSALSANALNPIYLGLSQLPGIANRSQLQEQIIKLQQLNTSQRVDYTAVHREKEIFLLKYFHSQSNILKSLPEYQQFKNYNPWLQGYALFKALKIHRHWQSWETWPGHLKNPDIHSLVNCCELQEEVEFHIFLQFLCFQQMKQVKSFASKQNILIKGDIPILINRESADVWLNRELFLMQYSAGAPPDMYSKEGQNWGFPLYNWTAMQNEFYQWWIERLNVASNFYHIYRIDHIVGFYRIWGIPKGLKPKEGFFIPENIKSWIPQGEVIMRMMLSNCDMLPIGEDLGTIPPEVRMNLKKLAICGTKVMRWERRWLTDKSFIDPLEYEPESMSTVSTHDSETLQLWWSNQPKEAHLYAKTLGFNYYPELTNKERILILTACHNSGSLFHINLLQEYLALIPNMTWPNPKDERINLPGTVSEKNWTYRFRPTVEEIIENQILGSAMNALLS